MTTDSPDLDAYRAKRSAGATPEPFGRPGAERPGLFVVQQHAARRLHWDLRLEIGGALHCWAVPKGPSLDPGEKRLAVETEDHPLEYADFEGVIPAGNYGAGAMIVWDRGRWVPIAEEKGGPRHGLEHGKLLFDLEGYKLRGRWTLVKTARAANEWLLIKKPDGWATGEDAEAMGAGSVLSGLTVEELAAGADRAGEIRAELERLGAKGRRLHAEKVKPQLAEVADAPFSRPGWLFELKYDGYRAIAGTEAGAGAHGGGAARLYYRSGREATASWPDLGRALAALPFASLVLDGEITVLDAAARPSFQRLQQRALLSRPADVERAAVQLPAAYFVFDLLGFEGYDLRGLPLAERKRLLRRVLPAAGPVRFADHVEERGEELFAAVRKAGVEGLVAKRADGRYRAGRSAAWLKIRAAHAGDFAVVGYTAPKGSRAGFGALHLAAWQAGGDGAGGLVYVGRVGTGFSDKQLGELYEQLAADEVDQAPCGPNAAGELPHGAEHHWVEPELVAVVRFTEVTDAGQLRHPVFERLRDDKTIEETALDGAVARDGGAGEDDGREAGSGGDPADEPDALPDEPPPPAEDPAAARPELRLSNLDKVFWPDDGVTKGDLLAYYRDVSPWLLPYLRDRPVVLDRYPDGIGGKSFFQKNVPDFVPDWIRTEVVVSDDGNETRYAICDDLETLLYLVNLGTIPLHLWSSRIGSLQAPDWSILDLDAKQSTFRHTVTVAKAIHDLCREIELDCFVKTSGATGLHVLIPLGGQMTHEQSRQLAELIARVVVAELPEVVTVMRTVADRDGRVYLDYLQNGYGKLLVAPFSVRPRPGAPASTPLTWREVNSKLDPAKHNVKTIPARFKRRKKDPLAPVLERRPDLGQALALLAERL